MEKEKVFWPYDGAPYQLVFTPEPCSTILVIVDMQYASGCRTTGLGKALTERGQADIIKWRFDRIEQFVVPNIQKLLAFFRERKLRVFHLTVGAILPDCSDAPTYMRELFLKTNNYEGSREHEILDELKPIKGEYVMNKTTKGAFTSTGMDSLLRSLGTKYLLFTGISTDQCVETTIRDSVDRDYRCVLIEDACAASQEELHQSAVGHHKKYWGRVISTDEIIKEMSAL